MLASDPNAAMAGSSLAPPSPLLRTPEEILVKILSFLSPRDQAMAARASRILKACTDTPRVRYERALTMAGCVDEPNHPKQEEAAPSAESTERQTSDSLRSPHTGKLRQSIPSVRFPPWPKQPPSTRQDVSHLSVAERAELLAKREAAWDTLTPRQVRTFRTTGAAGVYELQEGIYLLCMGQDFEVWGSRPKQIRLIPLPSATDPDLDDPIIPCKEVTMNFEIADLTMDPTQDLIVVAEHRPSALSRDRPPPVFKYHLLTMSTFKPHPLAKLPALDFPPALPVHYVAQQLIQVMGDTMVALVAVTDLRSGDHALAYEEMVAWNWKTGNVLGRVNIGRTLARCTLAMLSPTTVALAMPGTTTYQSRNMEHLGAAAILGHPERVATRPSIDIYSFAQREQKLVQQPLLRDDEDLDTPRGCLITRLLLPGITQKLVHQFHMRPDPAFPPSHTGLAHKPFGLDPRSGLLVIELQLDEYIPFQPINIGIPERYEIFLLRETLVDMAEEGEAARQAIWEASEGPAEPVPRVLTWKEWGEEHTRIMDPTMRRRLWVCSCSGYRYASIERYRNEGGVVQRTEVMVHDFNPYSVARERAQMKNAIRSADVEDAKKALQFVAESDDSPMAVDPPQDKDAGTVFDWLGGQPDEQDDPSPPWTALYEDGVYLRRVVEPLAEEVAEHCDNACLVELVTEPTLIDPLDSSFDEPVVSRLPYRTVTRLAPSDTEGVMIEDQRLLLISSVHHTTGDLERQKSNVTTWCF